MKRLGEKILFSLLCVLIFCFWFFLYRYHILYQERFTLFLFSSEYFFQYLLKPGGLSEYIGLFFIQFFRFPLIGILLYTFSFGIIYVLTAKIIKQLGFPAKWYGLLWIPALALLGMQMNYDFLFTETIKVIFYYLLFYTYLKLNSQLYRNIYSIAGSPLFFLLLGGGMFISFYISILLYEVLVKRKYFNPLYILWLVLAFIIPFIWKNFSLISNQNLFQIFNHVTEINYPILPFIISGYIPCSILIYESFGKIRYKKFISNYKLVNTLNFIFILLCIYLVKNKAYQVDNELFLHAHYAVMEEKWEDVTKITDKYNGNNNSIFILTNLALSQQNLLAEKLLDYKQIGINGMIFPKEGNYFTNFHNHEVYYRIGQNNEAFRWAFEAFASRSALSPPYLIKRLTELLISLEKYEAARKYLFYLAQTSCDKEWIKQTLMNLPSHSKPDSKPDYDSDFFIGLDPLYDLIHLSQLYPNNTVIRDYLLCGLLLEKKIPEFYQIFNYYYPSTNEKQFPKVYEEALLIVRYQIDENTLQKYGVSQECHNRFVEYTSALQHLDINNPDTPIALHSRFGNTLWYYYHFQNK